MRGANPAYKDSIIRYARKFNYSYRGKSLQEQVNQYFRAFLNNFNLES